VDVDQVGGLGGRSRARIHVVKSTTRCAPGPGARVPCVTMVKNSVDFVLRPFEGLPVEADLVAIREVVPSATIRVRTTKEHGDREVLLTTILPAGWAALHRSDGVLLVALQTTSGSGDASRDVAQALLEGLELEAGTPLENAPVPAPGPRLQDVLDPQGPFEVEVLEGFDHWLADDAERTPDIQAALED